MKTIDVFPEIEALVNGPSSLAEVVEGLRQLKASGVERAEALQALQRLREHTVNESAEDRVLEVMDFVAGFCSPHMTIWD